MKVDFYNDWGDRKMLQTVYTVGDTTRSVRINRSRTNDGRWVVPGSNYARVASLIDIFSYTRGHMASSGFIVGPLMFSFDRFHSQ